MPDRPRNRPVHACVIAVAAALASLLVSACGAPTPTGSRGPSLGPNSSPASSATPSPVVGAIDHPTGPADVVLRMEQGGGFVPIDFLASQAPTFTLFGNGVVVFKQKTDRLPQPDANGVRRSPAWRTAKLDEDQIQHLLEFAIGPGGLGTARLKYTDDRIADAGSSFFTLRAGGIDKIVEVYALAEATAAGPDATARAAFLTLSRRLADFDQGGSIATDAFTPTAWRAVLIEHERAGVEVPIAWPWPDITIADFTPAVDRGSGLPFPHRAMTDGEIQLLKLGKVDGGAQNIFLSAPTGKTYALTLRPLLRDEKE